MPKLEGVHVLVQLSRTGFCSGPFLDSLCILSGSLISARVLPERRAKVGQKLVRFQLVHLVAACAHGTRYTAYMQQGRLHPWRLEPFDPLPGARSVYADNGSQGRVTETA